MSDKRVYDDRVARILENGDFDYSNMDNDEYEAMQAKNVETARHDFEKNRAAMALEKMARANPSNFAAPLEAEVAAFQEDVERTWKAQHSSALDIAIAALGLVCEAGEVGDVIKKQIAQGHEVDRDKVLDELGDTYYYMTKLMGMYNITLSDVMSTNIAKRKLRYPEGFDANRSRTRGE